MLIPFIHSFINKAEDWKKNKKFRQIDWKSNLSFSIYQSHGIEKVTGTELQISHV